MNGWNPGVEEGIGYYVYVLIDPSTDQPFYVGKGTGGRCFGHIRRARRTTTDTVGDYAKLRTIRAIEEAGHKVCIEILRHGLDESTAFHVEAAAIDLLGLECLHNLVAGEHSEIGTMSVPDINAKNGAVPVTFDPSHRLPLIRINRKFGAYMSDRDLYDLRGPGALLGNGGPGDRLLRPGLPRHRRLTRHLSRELVYEGRPGEGMCPTVDTAG